MKLGRMPFQARAAVVTLGAIAVVTTLSACNLILGLGDYRDLCKPYGIGDPPDCVYADAGMPSSTTGTGSGGNGGAPACSPRATRVCYDGPGAPTAEVKGICKKGEQTCDVAGDGYGECKGQKLPEVESCASKEDENCDGLDCIEWNNDWRVSSGGAVVAQCLMVDPKSHDIFAAGLLSGALELPGKTLVPVGKGDGYLLHLNPTGAFRDVTLFGDTGFDDINSCTMDAEGNLIVAGVTDTGFSLGEKNIPVGIFVIKMSQAKKVIWSKSIGGTMPNSAAGPQSITVDPNGDLVLRGIFLSPLSLDDGTIPLTNELDSYLLKMGGADGATSIQTSGPVWTQHVPGGTELTNTTAATFDSTGNVLFAVTFADTINLFGQSWTSKGGTDVIFGKVSGRGVPIWMHQVGDSADQGVQSVATDNEGALLATGHFMGTLTLPDGSAISAGSKSAYAFRWQTTDDPGWIRSFGAGPILSVLGQGNDTVVAASFTTEIDFGGGAQQGGTGKNLGIAKLDSKGGEVWSRVFKSSDAGFLAPGLGADPTGEIVVSGVLPGTIDLGAGELHGQPVEEGLGDLIIAKFGR